MALRCAAIFPSASDASSSTMNSVLTPNTRGSIGRTTAAASTVTSHSCIARTSSAVASRSAPSSNQLVPTADSRCAVSAPPKSWTRTCACSPDSKTASSRCQRPARVACATARSCHSIVATRSTGRSAPEPFAHTLAT